MDTASLLNDRSPEILFGAEEVTDDLNPENYVTRETVDEDRLILIYRYYEMRGYKNIVLIKVNNLIITLFLLFTTIFVTTFINYSALFSDYKLENAIDFGRPIHPVLIVYMVFFLGYWLWKFAKTIYDLKEFNGIRKYYRDVLEIDDFRLQNTNWGTIRDRMADGHDRIDRAILRKDNFVLGVMRHVLTYHSWISLSKIMEWELGFIIMTYLFVGRRLREAIDIASFKKRLRMIGVINIIIIPFLLIFAGVYVVFRYGEIMCTKSRYITSREWSKSIRLRIRGYSELPHEFEDRLFRAKKYADKYYSFFRPTLVYNLAQLLLVLLGITFAVFAGMVVVNFNFLIKFELWGKSCFQYISLVFTGIVMLKTYLNKYTRVVGSEEKTRRYLGKMLEILEVGECELTRGSPIDKETFKEFSGRWYYSRVKIVLLELWGILTLPYIFIKTLPEFTESIVQYLDNNTSRGSPHGDFLVPEQLLIETI